MARRILRFLGAAAGPLTAAVGCVLLLVTLTVRLTVLDAGFDAQAVDRAHVYSRLYTQVLPGPVAEDLLAGLPVPPAAVTGAVRLVLPPETLRAVVAAEIQQLTGYLSGSEDELDLWPGLAPVLQNVRRLVDGYVQGAVADADVARVTSLPRLRANLVRFVDELASGRVPVAVPDLPLGPALSHEVGQLLESVIPDDRPEAVQQMRTFLAEGRTVDALAAAAPALFRGDRPAVLDLQHRARAQAQELQDAVRDVRASAGFAALRYARSAVHAGLAVGFASGSLLVAGGAAVTVVRARRRRRRIRRGLAAVAATAAGGGLLAGGLLSLLLPDPLHAVAAGDQLPVAVADLVQAVDDQVRSGIAHTWLLLLAVPAALALALVGPELATGAVRLAHRLRVPSWRWRPVAAGAAVVAGLAVAATVVPIGSSGPQTCEGYVQLCSRRYGDVTVLASHNAMASADLGFLQAEQGPSLTGQLDAGARALLVDTHYWTTPDEVAAFLAKLPEGTRRRLRPLIRLAASQRPGVWLCHSICQEGAVKATAAMQDVGRWLQAHRDAVVTVVIEDHTTPQDTMRVFEQAGLRRYLYTPPGDPSAPWPTLGQMVRSNRRLVVLSERNDVPGTWFRNLYRYTAENRWYAPDAAALACNPGRGPDRARLFLLNHFVTQDVPDMEAARRLNTVDAVLTHARRCEQRRDMTPTFVAVDFVGLGDPLDAVRLLNHLPLRG